MDQKRSFSFETAVCVTCLHHQYEEWLNISCKLNSWLLILLRKNIVVFIYLPQPACNSSTSNTCRALGTYGHAIEP